MLANKSTSTIVLVAVSAVIVSSIGIEIYAAIEAEEKEEPKLFGLKEYSKPKPLPTKESTCGAVCGGKCGGNIHDPEKRTTPGE
jgi:hypothetical protein